MSDLDRARAHLLNRQADLVEARIWKNSHSPRLGMTGYENNFFAALSWVWQCQEDEKARDAEGVRMSDWHPIDTAPKDGTVILLTWMENDEPAEVWPMQWGHIQRNGLFPENTGMWVTPDGSVTWNGGPNNGGPTHWKPEAQRAEGCG